MNALNELFLHSLFGTSLPMDFIHIGREELVTKVMQSKSIRKDADPIEEMRNFPH